MSTKDDRPEARLPKGLFDVPAGEIRASREMLDTIRGVFESYGFEPLDTPAIEYTDALGKFLPDQDRPNEGVFSFKDDDEQWLSLRYDLTAPLARYVAENFQNLPKPFRRYQVGPVWRNEKPGPGRFRQFTQFDADTVGASSVAADAELCMLAADTLEALGVERGQYVIKVNNRKVLGWRAGGHCRDWKQHARKATRRAAGDRQTRSAWELMACERCLGKGRKDESGDFTKGADLEPDQIDWSFIVAIRDVGSTTSLGEVPTFERTDPCELQRCLERDADTRSKSLAAACYEEHRRARAIATLVRSAGYGRDRITH